MRDPELFIVDNGYLIRKWSKECIERSSIRTMAEQNHLETIYDRTEDILLIKGSFENLHSFLKDITYYYDIVIR